MVPCTSLSAGNYMAMLELTFESRKDSLSARKRNGKPEMKPGKPLD
jgi:hypothetical protein